MQITPLTYARVQVTLDHPIEKVWMTVADFGGISPWIAGVSNCTVESEGVGAVRTVSIGDRTTREQLEMLDHISSSLRYCILAPHSMPAQNVRSTIRLTGLNDSRTQVEWFSEATDFTEPPEKLGAGIEIFYLRSLDGLAWLLDSA